MADNHADAIGADDLLTEIGRVGPCDGRRSNDSMVYPSMSAYVTTDSSLMATTTLTPSSSRSAGGRSASCEARFALHWIRVNGQIGLYIVRAGEPFLLTVVGWRDAKVTELLAIANPAKLERFHTRWLAGGTESAS